VYLFAPSTIHRCLEFSKPGPGFIKPEWVREMEKDAIVFACAQPVPEIWLREGQASGARVFATGRSDFADAIDDSLGFPAIFHGTLQVRGRTLADEMPSAAARELARCAEDKGIGEDWAVPTRDVRQVCQLFV
jgi:malate dehydrogenase (oxaloacetate-decarboxylating)